MLAVDGFGDLAFSQNNVGTILRRMADGEFKAGDNVAVPMLNNQRDYSRGEVSKRIAEAIADIINSSGGGYLKATHEENVSAPLLPQTLGKNYMVKITFV